MGEENGERKKTHRFVLTEILALPQAFLCFRPIFPPVTSGKAIPVGERGGREEEHLRE